MRVQLPHLSNLHSLSLSWFSAFKPQLEGSQHFPSLILLSSYQELYPLWAHPEISGEKCSIKGSWTLLPWSSIKNSSYKHKFSIEIHAYMTEIASMYKEMYVSLRQEIKPFLTKPLPWWHFLLKILFMWNIYSHINNGIFGSNFVSLSILFLHMVSVFRTLNGIKIRKMRSIRSLRFDTLSNNLKFELSLRSWSKSDHSSPLGIFWTQKYLITCSVDESTTPSPFQPPSTFPFLA